ncbi:MAG: Ig-like domain-containing protein [Candidatus Helarchaeota archaeon]
MNNIKNRKSLAPVLIIVIIFLLIAGAMFLNRQQIIFKGRASPSKTYSLQNSYIFGSPLTAMANGQEKIKISVFLLNQQGLGVEKKQVKLKVTPVGLDIETTQDITDKTGQAIFYASTKSPGRFQVSAQVDGQTFPQTVTVNFR